MKQVPITNTSSANLHIAGVVIRPGSSRMVDAALVPPDLLPDEAQPEEPASDGTDALDALLLGSVLEITKALPGLSDDDLTRINSREGVGKKRKGVFDAIAHERLRRAANHDQGGEGSEGGEDAGEAAGEGGTTEGEGNA